MNKWTLVGLTAGIVILADQVSKWGVWNYVAPLRRVEVIPGFFDLSFVMNTGVAFGMMSGGRDTLRILGLVAVGLIALGVIFIFIWKARRDERLFLFGLALVSGGAVGNLIDRVRLGAVIDFLDLYVGRRHWPSFNVADVGISAGTALILLYLWKTRKEEQG